MNKASAVQFLWLESMRSLWSVPAKQPAMLASNLQKRRNTLKELVLL